MAWTAPATYTTNQIVVAADLNLTRDNLIDLDRRTSPSGAWDAGVGTRTPATYGDLAAASVGPAVAATIGAGRKALVSIYSSIAVNTLGGVGYAGFAVTGATTRAAGDDQSLAFTAPVANGGIRMGATFLLDSGELTAAGSTTFTMKYRTNDGIVIATYSNRRIAVTPLGS